MKQSDLATALGISQGMVSRHAKMGMPTDSVEAARRWRDRHLELARRKEYRGDMPPRAAAPRVDHGALERAGRSMALAAELLALGHFEWIRATLQADMRAVPPELRPGLLLNFEVMDALVADVVAAMDDVDEAGAVAPPPLSEVDAEVMGAFWYAAACGEVAAAP